MDLPTSIKILCVRCRTKRVTEGTLCNDCETKLYKQAYQK